MNIQAITTTEPRAILLYRHQCALCGHVMESRQKRPRQCWRCKSRNWDKAKS